MLDADLEAVAGEDEILLAHALRDVAAHLVDAEVDLVADPGEGGEDEEGQDQGEELSVRMRCWLFFSGLLCLSSGKKKKEFLFPFCFPFTYHFVL